MLVRDLIRQIPSDTRERVHETYRQINPAIRQVLRDVSRLLLEWEPEDGTQGLKCACGVEVDEVGYPTNCHWAAIPAEYELAARLALWLPQLERLKLAAGQSTVMLRQLGDDLRGTTDVQAGSNALKTVGDMAERLIRAARVGDFDLVRHILAVDDDVLGHYEYSTEEAIAYYPNVRSQIRLYWGVVGLVAQALDVSIEGLTAKVLAHELAHAYTHLGFDRDGTRWMGNGFGLSDTRLKEALAQYYTCQVLMKLERRLPDGLVAYKKLLPKQPEAYRAHLPWLEHATLEAVGIALSAVRRRGRVSYEEFSHEIGVARRRLNLQ